MFFLIDNQSRFIGDDEAICKALAGVVTASLTR